MSDPLDKNLSKKISKLALLWGEAQPTVNAYIRASLRNHHDSEDVTQATVQYIVEHFDEFDLSTNFVAWAIGIARYRVLECIRQRQRSERVLSDDVIQMLPDAFVAIEGQVLPQQEALEKCMEKLNDRSKDVLYRKYYGGSRHEEIGGALGIASSSVTVLLRRIRETLAKCIEARMSAEGGHVDNRSLCLQYLMGDASDQEVATLSEWIAESPNNAKAFVLLAARDVHLATAVGKRCQPDGQSSDLLAEPAALELVRTNNGNGQFVASGNSTYKVAKWRETMNSQAIVLGDRLLDVVGNAFGARPLTSVCGIAIRVKPSGAWFGTTTTPSRKVPRFLKRGTAPSTIGTITSTPHNQGSAATSSRPQAKQSATRQATQCSFPIFIPACSELTAYE